MYLNKNSILLIFSVFFNVYFLINNNADKSAPHDYYEERTKSIQDYYKLAKSLKLDKVGVHSYHLVYGPYLGRLRNQHVNFLEIGIGCHQPYGAGKSLELWKLYFPSITLHSMEYDGECAEKFRSKVDKLYIGDQSDADTLNKIGENGGPFDVIIDDGGHSRKQQMTSLIELWKYVKPNGGIYVIEDIFTAFAIRYNDSNESPFDFVVDNLKMFFSPTYTGQKSIVEIPTDQKLVEFHKSVVSIDCFKGACVFVKK